MTNFDEETDDLELILKEMQFNQEEQKIIILRYQEYKFKEISELTNIKLSNIYNKNIKKKAKKFTNS